MDSTRSAQARTSATGHTACRNASHRGVGTNAGVTAALRRCTVAGSIAANAGAAVLAAKLYALPPAHRISGAESQSATRTEHGFQPPSTRAVIIAAMPLAPALVMNRFRRTAWRYASVLLS